MKKVIILSFILIIASSCGQLKRSYPARNFYTLEVSQLENNLSNGNEYLKIVRVRLNPEYYHQDFNYKIADKQFQNDYYNQFYKPIDLIVIAELYKWMSNSGIFKEVLPANNIVDAKYYIYANIVDIYADFTGPGPKAVLNMQFFLIDESDAVPRLAYTNVYNLETALTDSLPGTIVDGWNKNLKEIFTQFQNDLSSLSELDN
ncbi:MAG: hypothetical protein ACR2NW_03875 [Thermodesulfobacteriota bacterium]